MATSPTEISAEDNITSGDILPGFELQLQNLSR